MAKVAAEVVNAHNSLKKNELLNLSSDEGTSLRGLKMRVSRTTRSHGVAVELWDDGQAQYVRRAEQR